MSAFQAHEPDCSLTVCHGCDLLLRDVEVPDGLVADCPRCGSRLRTAYDNTVSATLAASLAGLLLMWPATFEPLLTLDAMGIRDSGSLFESFFAFYKNGFPIVAVMVLLTAIVFPLVKLLLLFSASALLLMRRGVPLLRYLLRTVCHLDEWAMLEVYLISIPVTLIKIYSMAKIEYEYGFYCFVGLVLATVLASLVFDAEGFWQRIEALGRGEAKAPSPRLATPPASACALQAGVLQCHDCGKVLLAPEGSDTHGLSCPRCGADVHARTPNSVARTWALVFTAILLLLPANLLPIMRVDMLGTVENSTIMDGIIYFFHHGPVFIGLIIFTASVLVPLFKVMGLILILLSVHFRWQRWLRHKTVMFGFIEFIGRWSMLDIFVIALLQMLVNFGALSRIEVAPAATYFGFVVVSTMLAVISFDSRLLWDAHPGRDED